MNVTCIYIYTHIYICERPSAGMVMASSPEQTATVTWTRSRYSKKVLKSTLLLLGGRTVQTFRASCACMHVIQHIVDHFCGRLFETFLFELLHSLCMDVQLQDCRRIQSCTLAAWSNTTGRLMQFASNCHDQAGGALGSAALVSEVSLDLHVPN